MHAVIIICFGMFSPGTACVPFLCGWSATQAVIVQPPPKTAVSVSANEELRDPTATIQAFPIHSSVDLVNTPRGFSRKAQLLPTSVLHLTAFGDWGNPEQPSLVSDIGRYLKRKQTRAELDAVLLLGDNFYPVGVSDHTDPLWCLFTDGLAKRVTKPFYSILGNHDLWGNRTAQVSYEHPLWQTDARNFLIEYASEGFRTCVWMMHYDMTTAEWIIALRDSLAIHASRCHWRIIATHVPVVSGGVYRHSREVRYLVKALSPLLNAYSIHLHISGHEHASQVLRRAINPRTLFLIAGATTDDRYHGRGIDHRQDNLVWVDTLSFPAVLDIRATIDELSVRFVSVNDENVSLFETVIGHVGASN
jgi:hypothetical protein